MPYLIDGNNLLGLRSEIRLKDPGARSRLLQRLAAFSRARRTKVIVVFDGEPEPGTGGSEVHLGEMRVLYAGRKTDADTLILRLLEEAADPAGFVLVTSDRALGDRARHRRVRNVTASRKFQRALDELVPAGTGPAGPLTPDEVADWEAWFRRKDPLPEGPE